MTHKNRSSYIFWDKPYSYQSQYAYIVINGYELNACSYVASMLQQKLNKQI